MPGQTYRAVTSFCIARTPGWERECSESKTARLNLAGTTGRGMPVDVSQMTVVSDVCAGTEVSFNDEVVDSNSLISGSSSCANPISLKSRRALTEIRESAFATGLSTPLIYLMSDVNWDMKSKCRTIDTIVSMVAPDVEYNVPNGR